MAIGFGNTATYQFYRTERWLGRLKAIHSGQHMPVGSFDDSLDHVLAFFLNCYHIKDWLKNGPDWHEGVEREVKERAVEQFVAESQELQICADLCNGNKHFHFDQQLRSGTAPEFHSIHVSVDATKCPPTTTTRYMLRTAKGTVDAYELASECIDLWRSFIWTSTPDSLSVLASRNRGAPASRRMRRRRAGSENATQGSGLDGPRSCDAPRRSEDAPWES